MKKNSFYIVLLFITFCVLWLSSLFGQSNPPLRIDIPLSSQNQYIHLENLQEDGVLALIDNNDEKSWTIIHYDTILRTKINKNINFNHNVILRQTFYENYYFCAALQLYGSYSKTSQFNTFFLTYNLLTKKINIFALHTEEKSEITALAFFEQNIIFELNDNKNQFNTYLFNCNTKTYNLLFDETKPISLQSAHIDTTTKTLIIGCIDYQQNRNNILFFELDSIGEKQENLKINIENSYNIDYFDFQFFKSSNQVLVFGTFSSKEKSLFSKNSSDGIFVLPIINNIPQQANFTNYLQMEKMFANQKKSAISALHSHNYPIFANDSTLLLISEFFVPEYEQDLMASDFYYMGLPYGRGTQMKFVGYRYAHAAIFYLDINGNLKSCNGFNFNGLILKENKKILKAYIDAENQLLVYFPHDGKAYSTIYQNDKIIQPIQAENIDLCSKTEILSKNLSSGMEHWYKDYFLYFGHQRLFKKGSSKKNAFRSVFFITKMIYD